MYAMTKMINIADSATIRHAIPTTPRCGSVHGGSICALIGTALVACVIRNPRPDLPDVSDPTADGGCGLLAPPQSCTRVAERASPTPTSTRPTDHVRLSRRDSTTAPCCRQKSAFPPSEKLHQFQRSDSNPPSRVPPHTYKSVVACPASPAHA